MKALLPLLLVALVAHAEPLTVKELMKLELVKVPALLHELPDETESRRSLWRWKFRTVEAGRWTAGMEADYRAMLLEVAQAMKKRLAKS